MMVQLTKRSDGSVVIRCVRTDGSATWQRHQARQAAFFPLHDLTHFAVESEFGFRSGFYGLLANGWNMEDTSGKGARGSLPHEALAVEHFVEMLDLERACGITWTAAELNKQAADFAAAGGRSTPSAFTDTDLERVRSRIRALFDEWYSLMPESTLELTFARPVVGDRPGDDRKRTIGC